LIKTVFEYELEGKLLLKTYADGSQRKYYYDGIRVILEKTKPAQGSWTTSKVYTLGGGDIGFIIGEREISGQNNTDKWYHYDRLGNVMAQTNSSGQALATYEQDAFGNVLSGSSNGYHLTTKDNHTDIGLYYFYARWYDPLLGRFTQKDPLFNNPDYYSYIHLIYNLSNYENPYIYCYNNPIFYIDSEGLDAVGILITLCLFVIQDAVYNDGKICKICCDPIWRLGDLIGKAAWCFCECCSKQFSKDVQLKECFGMGVNPHPRL